MFDATREKTRLWLLILVGVVATLLGQTHAREIFAPSPDESGVFATQTPTTTEDFYDGGRYDVPDSLLAANNAVPQVLRNQPAGNAARDAIAAARPGSLIEQNFRVTGGLRRVDVLDGVTAIESKVGRTSLTAPVRQELARDIKMLRSGQVDAVQWHFSPSPTTGLGGPTGPLRAKLDKFGIPIVE